MTPHVTLVLKVVRSADIHDRFRDIHHKVAAQTAK